MKKTILIGSGLKRYSYVLCAVAVLVICYAALQKTSHLPGAPEQIVRNNIQYGFTIRNTTNKMVKNAQFQTYAPVRKTGTQLRKDLIASHSYEIISKGTDNELLFFTLKDLPPFSSKIITIKANLLFFPQPGKMRPQALKQYLAAEPYIESDDPEIQKLANQFSGLHTPDRAKKIFKWVSEHIQYSGYSKNSKGARYALATGKGDCTEFMYLFVALCRAGNIPARGISGYVAENSTVLKAIHHHNWAEFYSDGKWVLSDPQRRVFDDFTAPYVAMKIISHSRPTTDNDFERYRIKGKGLKVKMNT